MLRLSVFPVTIPVGGGVSFHDGFLDLRRGAPHVAIDIGAPERTFIVSTTAGRVATSWMSGHGRVTGCGYSARGGNVVLIVDEAQGFVHYYAHMYSAPRVRAGDTVRVGALLGEVSNTGSIAAGGSPHLHYQVWPIGAHRETEIAEGVFHRRFGRAVNPYPELARRARAMGASVGSNSSVRF